MIYYDICFVMLGTAARKQVETLVLNINFFYYLNVHWNFRLLPDSNSSPSELQPNDSNDDDDDDDLKP